MGRRLHSLHPFPHPSLLRRGSGCPQFGCQRFRLYLHTANVLLSPLESYRRGHTTSAVTAEQNSSQLLPRYFPDTSQILPRFCTRVYVGTKTLNHRPYHDDLHRRRRRRRIDTIIATTVAVATTLTPLCRHRCRCLHCGRRCHTILVVFVVHRDKLIHHAGSWGNRSGRSAKVVY